jgi:hypothetical protein
LINPNDKFKEIDIYDDGPSDDPKTTFFIYDGKQIIKVGKILANEYMIDKNSKIFTNLDEINFFKPGINVGWTELDHNHKFTYKTLEKDQFINKQYEIAYERDSEKNPWRIYTDSKSSQYEENYIATVNQGDTVTVLDIIRQGERDIAFMLKLNNGKEGWINLFNGD